MIEVEDKKTKVYEYIVRYFEKNMCSPSIREICDNTGIKSTSTVFVKIRELEEEGLILIQDNKTRNITPTGYHVVKER